MQIQNSIDKYNLHKVKSPTTFDDVQLHKNKSNLEKGIKKIEKRKKKREVWIEIETCSPSSTTNSKPNCSLT